MNNLKPEFERKFSRNEIKTNCVEPLYKFIFKTTVKLPQYVNQVIILEDFQAMIEKTS